MPEQPAVAVPEARAAGRQPAMQQVLTPLRVLRHSAAKAWADMWAMYSPLGWCLGWMSRVLMQVIFFAIIGLLLGDPDRVRYLFIGAAVMVTAVEALISVASTTWERRQGTLPLLVAAPTRLWPVFVARSVQWIPSGVLTASVALFGLGPFFGITFTPLRGLATFACLVVAAATTYLFAMVLGALVLSAISLRNVVSNVAQAVLMLACGVVVPVGFWPGWVQGVAQTLPLTHALAAVRALADPPGGFPAAEVGRGLLLAVVAGAGWLVVAALVLERLAAAGRRTGSIEFAD